MTPRPRPKQTRSRMAAGSAGQARPRGRPAGSHARERSGEERGAAGPGLIHFDRRTLLFLGVLLLLFALGTTFKLHGSSIGLWGRFVGGSPDSGVLLGSPKGIRADEWTFTTPAILSQARARPPFSPDNPSWGPGRAPLIMNLPVRHWSALVRPQFWGFFALDLERGFSFYWNMKALLLVSGSFLLLMLLTGSRFGVSLLGTGWIFFSGFMQWWYSTPAALPEMVGCFALAVVAAHYTALSSRRWVIAASALAFSVFVLDFALSVYPAFQIPLFYLGIAVLVGSLGPRLRGDAARHHRPLRIACAALALTAVAGLLLLYYRDARGAIQLMRGTVYPGSRVSTGGEVSLAQLFSGFYGFFMTEQAFPQAWFNVCEASNFVLFFPIPAAALLWHAWRKGRVSALEWALMAVIGIDLTWVLLGWPRFLAVVSGFGLSQGTRSLLGLGLASILLCCVYLARTRVDLPSGAAARLVLAISLLALAAALGVGFNRSTGGFATGDQVTLVSLVAAAAGFLLLERRRIAFAACVLLPGVWSYALVNPVATGLGPILQSTIVREVSPVIRRDPGARWVVYGNSILADLLKAGGADVFNGTNYVPPLDALRVIDPRASSDSIYNRYAHISLVPGRGPTISYKVFHGDAYRIEIDPNSDVWRRLGVKYVALTSEPEDPGFLAGTEPVLALPAERLWVYRYR